MTRGRLTDSAYAPHSMDPAFRVNRSPLLPERPRFSRRETEFFYDDSDDGEDDFYDSQDMPNYDDPAFSIDPRDNPHLMSRTDVSRMRTSPIPPAYSEFEGGNEERLAYRSHDSSQRKSRTRSRSPFPPQPPLTTSSPSGSYSSGSNEHSPFHGSSTTSHQTSVENSRNVSPATSEKVDHIQVKPQKSVRNSPRGDLDKVDQLDVTDPFGFMRHHDGPYQTVNDALTKRTPLPKTHNEQRKPKVQPQPQTHIPTSTSYTGGVLNLVPGQLMRKMPYQPEPPPDWVSPPPTVGRLPTVSYPDQYSYDPSDIIPQMAPHPSEYISPARYQSPMQSLSFPTLASLSPNPNTVLSITNPDPGSPFPTLQPAVPNSGRQHHPPSTRRSRLSLSAQSRPSESPRQSPPQKPSSDVSRTPSMPITSSPASSSQDKLGPRASTLNTHSRSYDAHLHELVVERPEIHKPHDRDPVLSRNQQSFEPPRDSHLLPPDIRLPSAPSVMTSSTNSSKKSGKGLPRHVPKKLVMPTPLQPLQNLNQGLAQGNPGSTNSTYYSPLHSYSSPPMSSASVPTSTHAHQQLHLSKSRKSHNGGLTREMQMARASGFYPPPMSHSRSQHHQSPGIQPSLSVHSPPVATSDRSDRSPRPDPEQEREHRRGRRQTMMNPGLGTYLEAKASSNAFQSSVGSRSATTSDAPGSRSERRRGRSHHRASSDGYRAGYESSSHGGRYPEAHGYSDSNLPANGQLHPHQQPEVYPHGYDPRITYDAQQGHGYDAHPRDHDRERKRRERRERRERDRERGRSHRHTQSYPNGVPPSQPHSHSPQPHPQPHIAQEVPIIKDDKHTRHTLKKRATLTGQGMSWTISVNDAGVAVATPIKEKRRSKSKSQSHLGHGGAEGISPYLDVPELKDREKSSQSNKARKSSGFGLGSLFRSLSSKGKEEEGDLEKERMYREWATSGAGAAISNSSSRSGRKLSKVRSRH